MRALSIRQPWAWAILHAGKRVENRGWQEGSGNLAAARRLVGQKLLLHASKGIGRGEFDEAVESIIDVVKPQAGNERRAFLASLAKMHVPLRGKHHGEGTWRPADGLPFGGIVGRARLADVRRTARNGCRWGRDSKCLLCGMSPGETLGGLCPKADPWAVPGAVGLILADVEPLPFVSLKGALGFFEVPDAPIARSP